MALGRMHGAALAAALAVLTGDRARDYGQAPAVLTRPSRHGQELGGVSWPAAKRAASWRLAASSRPSAAAALTISRFAIRPILREISARYAPSAGRRGCSCVLSGPEPSLLLSEMRCIQCVLESQIVGSPERHPLEAEHTGERCPPIRPGRGNARCATRGPDGTWPSSCGWPLDLRPCS